MFLGHAVVAYVVGETDVDPRAPGGQASAMAKIGRPRRAGEVAKPRSLHVPYGVGVQLARYCEEHECQAGDLVRQMVRPTGASAAADGARDLPKRPRGTTGKRWKTSYRATDDEHAEIMAALKPWGLSIPRAVEGLLAAKGYTVNADDEGASED